MAGVLHEVNEETIVPTGFFSKKFSGPQTRYATFDKELTAAYNAVLHFKHHLLGRRTFLFTDHKPLVSAFKKEGELKSDRQARHMAVISEYIDDVIFVRGKDNVVADYLSRMDESPQEQSSQEEKSEDAQEDTSLNEGRVVNAIQIEEIDYEEIAKEQTNDPDIEGLKDKLKAKEAGKLKIFVNEDTGIPRPFIPKRLQEKTVKSLHKLGHFGKKATSKMIKERVFFKDIDKTVSKVCDECLTCQRNKVTKTTKVQDMPFIPKATGTFQYIHIDIVGPLETSG